MKRNSSLLETPRATGAAPLINSGKHAFFDLETVLLSPEPFFSNYQEVLGGENNRMGLPLRLEGGAAIDMIVRLIFKTRLPYEAFEETMMPLSSWSGVGRPAEGPHLVPFSMVTSLVFADRSTTRSQELLCHGVKHEALDAFKG